MRKVKQQEPFEVLFRTSTSAYFLREFCFSRTEFSPPDQSQVELADFVVQLDDLLLVFQLKSRNTPSEEPERERSWFQRKVLGKATQQVRHTIDYLRSLATEIVNDRGRRIRMPTGPDVMRAVKVVVFNGGAALPFDCVQHRFHESRTEGFIHVVAASDWHETLRTLVTPREIADYLQMRERLCRTHPEQIRTVSEKALVGQFIAEREDAVPSTAFELAVDRLRRDNASFDVFHFLGLFGDRLVSDAPPGTSRPVDLRAANVDYYPIIREIAKLPRTDLAAFKERFALGWQRAGQYVNPPFTRMVCSTGTGFVFSPVPSGLESQAQNGLANHISAHMYEQRITRCVGAAFVNEGQSRFIWWMMIDQPWVPNSDMDAFLREHPIADVRVSGIPRYRLGNE